MNHEIDRDDAKYFQTEPIRIVNCPPGDSELTCESVERHLQTCELHPVLTITGKAADFGGYKWSDGDDRPKIDLDKKLAERHDHA